VAKRLAPVGLHIVPIHYRLLPDPDLVYTVATGVVAAAEISLMARRQLRDPQWLPDRRELVDLRAVERVELSPEQSWGLMRMSPFGAGARRAIVAHSASSYGIARMYAGLHEEGAAEIRVFREWREALAWLQLPADWDPERRESGEAPESG